MSAERATVSRFSIENCLHESPRPSRSARNRLDQHFPPTPRRSFNMRVVESVSLRARVFGRRLNISFNLVNFKFDIEIFVENVKKSLTRHRRKWNVLLDLDARTTRHSIPTRPSDSRPLAEKAPSGRKKDS
jgi:hypothetical protein